MLHEIYSDDDRFKTVVLRRGMNILLADKLVHSADTDSRNGAGKSSFVEILHYLLGMRSLTGSVLSNAALKSHSFGLRMDWPQRKERVSVGRSLVARQRSRVDLAPNVLVSAQLSGAAGSVSVPEWVEVLGRDLFSMPPEHKGISARALLSLYMRRVSQHGLDDPVVTYPRQSKGEATAHVAYLLGLDWRLASEYQALAGRESLRRKLKEAIKDPTFSLVVGSVSELRGSVTAAAKRVRDLEAQVSSFTVVPEYERLQAEADSLDAEIRKTRAQDAADRRNLMDLETAVRTEQEPDAAYLQRAYRELGITLPDTILRQYEEVHAFHSSVVANRRAYLAEEMALTRARLEERQAARDQMGEQHSRLLKSLHDGGALGALTALQEQLAVAKAEHKSLDLRFDTAKKLETTQAEIKYERGRLQQSITRDLLERETLIEQINLQFQAFASALYGSSREAYVDIAAHEANLHISPHIGGEDSQGIGRMVIFCFDLTVAVLAHRAGRGPDFLVHDSHLFDGVDERQVAKALNLALAVCQDEGFQYIITMNSDELEKVERHGSSMRDYVISPRLTDAYEDGGLFGFRFD
ncbi:conserved hypothetical protein [Pseudarthrobacter siccitolerans]|uniref:Uncharacterized protein n=1 Tax=Pseudarthrobacter siccitolerans TaxID=861266 RepID=A0A024GWU8_9MICC|nr:ABC-three component system protein [Pseudarthrobacter siccitolerans]CCQ44425.1 conserved hypothetical protein [Pseudarthrobacter siccitolerans]